MSITSRSRVQDAYGIGVKETDEFGLMVCSRRVTLRKRVFGTSRSAIRAAAMAVGTRTWI